MKLSCLVACTLLIAVSMAQASNNSIVTAVYSRTYNGYQRPKSADGSPQREYYAIANGTFLPGASVDSSIDKVKFPQIAGATAQFLALRNYHLAPDAKQADFLLIITWGKTLPFSDSAIRSNRDSLFSTMNHYVTVKNDLKASGGSSHDISGAASKETILAQEALNDLQGEVYQAQMFSDMQRNADEFNAKLLGYVDEINRHDTPAQFAGAGTAYHDLIADLENERYFFVISAYDFPTATKTGKRKLLWATRVSIQAQGNKFNEAAGLMLAKASKYFGQDSGRLIQEFEPEGKVTLGELKVLGVVPDSKPTTPPEGKK